MKALENRRAGTLGEAGRMYIHDIYAGTYIYVCEKLLWAGIPIVDVRFDGPVREWS